MSEVPTVAEHPLQDRVVQQAVSRVQLRSERQESLEQLAATFVDPGISVQLQNDNNQILYGRRGTGKTHMLKVIHLEAQKAEKALAVYLDMRNLGSSSVFNDEGRPLHVRVSSLLRDLLTIVEGELLEWATNPAVNLSGNVLEALDALSSAVARTTMTDVEVHEEQGAWSAHTADAGISAAVAPVPSVGISSRDSTSDEATVSVSRSGREIQPIYFQEFAEALDRVLMEGGLERLTVLLDEWTAIPLDLQPLLAEFLKRTLFTNPRVTVKIGSIEYRSNFSEPLGRNNVLGFELGADISSLIELDDYFVYDRNPDRTVGMFSELLYRHIAAEVSSDDGNGYLASEYGIEDPERFVDGLFSSRQAFQELVRAGEGVVRDFINIFTSAFFNAVRRQRDLIDVRAVQQAAREWYEKDKAANLDGQQQQLLRRILDRVIGDRRARSFLLEKQYEKHEAIRSLFDFRVLHLVQRGYADKDNPGLRYNIYTLDYGTYVDLLGTQRAPTEDFTETLADTDDEVIVPFDDRRSIRRIILRPEHLSARDE